MPTGEGHLYPTTPLRYMAGFGIVCPDGLRWKKHNIDLLTHRVD